MIKILFICHGNICRSTMAEYVMKHLVKKAGLEDHFFIDSAATSSEELGSGVHPGTRRKLSQVGIPCGEHRARLLRREEYGAFDLLIGMDSANLRNMRRLYTNDPQKKLHVLLEFTGSDRDIADPWYTGNFDATYEDVLCGCTALLEQLKKAI